MCGITGIISFNSDTSVTDLIEMCQTLKHRGPDSSNYVVKYLNNMQIGFAHTRLSIIDLTDAGSQPMCVKQYTIVFNGEIYNYKEIREELENLGYVFKSNSDTEVIILAFDHWKEEAVNKFIGMFAFVLLDEKNYKIYFYRDRSGIKPLHYYFKNDVFLFGSELKAILKHPLFKKSINENAIGLYFKLGYIPSPLTIYNDTFKINPGNFAILNLNTRKFEIKKYWDSIEFFQKPKLKISYTEAKEEIKRLLISSCNYRMVADVPVGIFLSGGFDSSAVTAILQTDRTEKLKTFTIGFEDGINEAPFAKQTAKFLGTDHYEYICTSKIAQDIIPELPLYFDEPFADSSSIPTLLVSRLARTKVKVALSADAGDELFAGYNSYCSLYKNINFLKSISFLDHRFIGLFLKKVSILLNKESFMTQRMQYLGQLLTNKVNLRASLLQEGAQSLSSQIFEKLVKGIKYPGNLLFYDEDLFGDPISVGQAVDYNLVFHNDLLTKVDRASMAVSLEGREPLVDHRLYEFVAQLPVEFKFKDFDRKKIFKEIVYEYIPEQLMNRPKQGFTLPICAWLRGDLLYLLEENLCEKAINKTGFLNAKYVDHLFKLFKQQKLHDEFLIWKILQFQIWYNLWMK